jgi:hypothetical protein
VNISRIDSARGNRIYNYRLLGKRLQRGENLSSVKMNILRTNSLGNEMGIITTFLLGRKPTKEEYLSPIRMNISRIDYLGKRENESAGEKGK